VSFPIFAARRGLAAISVLLLVIVASFAILHLVPGDPVEVILAATPHDQASSDRLRQALGLNDSLLVQLARYVVNVAQGNLGTSYVSQQPVALVVAARLPYTLVLAACGVLVGLVVGLPFGLLAAVRSSRVRRSDVGFNLVTSALISTPDFLLATALAFVFAVWLGILPVAGAGGPSSLVLPALALGIPLAGVQARVVKAALGDVLQQDFVRTLRSAGLRERRLIVRNVLRNALVPVVALLGVEFARLLGGTLIVENVFAWPGIGTVLFTSISQRDLPAVQGEILSIAVLIVFINFGVDVLTRFVDPRTSA
jgi:ABC-type dipeptide/oligopeptide/nickel transport system permease component